MSILLRLYPRRWRDRYGEEMRLHLDHEPKSLRLTFDLIAGAVDAWQNQSLVPEKSPQEGETDMTGSSLISRARCRSSAISNTEALQSAGLMIGITLALTGLAVFLDKRYGDHLMIDALMHSTLFIALTVSSNNTFLKPYSRAARSVIVGVSIVGWYLFFLAVGYLGAVI